VIEPVISTDTQIAMPRVLNKRTDPIPPNSRYCGRPSPLGNAFEIGRDGSRATVILKHKKSLLGRPTLLDKIRRLEGSNLICWCAPLPCHCDIYLRLANPHPFNKTFEDIIEEIIAAH
jgi:hypothetical protein